MKLLKKTFQGTTIIEAMIAMVVITIAFAAGMQTVERVWDTEKIGFDFRIENELKALSNTIKADRLFVDEVYEYDDFSINARFSVYENYQNVVQMELTVFNEEENEVITKRELIYAP